jgi:hypothetical protein
VFSINKHILDAEAQRALWIRENVGGVFLTSGKEKKREVMLMILKNWDWLETIDRHQPRPFAYLLPLSGRSPKLDPPRSRSHEAAYCRWRVRSLHKVLMRVAFATATEWVARLLRRAARSTAGRRTASPRPRFR